jgi:hypothetical protein
MRLSASLHVGARHPASPRARPSPTGGAAPAAGAAARRTLSGNVCGLTASLTPPGAQAPFGTRGGGGSGPRPHGAPALWRTGRRAGGPAPRLGGRQPCRRGRLGPGCRGRGRGVIPPYPTGACTLFQRCRGAEAGGLRRVAYSHRRALRRQRIGVRLSFLAEYIQTIVTLVRRIRCNGDETQESQPQLLNARLLNARLTYDLYGRTWVHVFV